MLKTKQKFQITNRLKIFMGGMVLANIPDAMFRGIFALYLMELGATIEQVGLYFTLGMVAPLMFQILGGWLSDRMGRIRTVAFGSIAGSLGFLVLILAPSWQWMLATTIFSAMGRALVGPSFRAFIAEESDPEHLAKTYGFADSIFQIVGIVGPILGGVLADQFGFHSMLIVAAILFWLATALRLWLANWDRRRNGAETREQKPIEFKHLLMDLKAITALLVGGGIITWMFISDGILDISFSLSDQFFSVYLEESIGLTKTLIGTTSSATSLAMIGAYAVGGVLSDKWGERYGIVLGAIIGFFAYALFIIGKVYFDFMVVSVLFGLALGLFGPSYNSLISKVIPEDKRGIAFGFFNTSLGVISLPAPYLGSLMWKYINPLAPFWAPMISLLLVVPIAWFKFRLDKKEEVEPTVEADPV